MGLLLTHYTVKEILDILKKKLEMTSVNSLVKSLLVSWVFKAYQIRLDVRI